MPEQHYPRNPIQEAVFEVFAGVRDGRAEDVAPFEKDAFFAQFPEFDKDESQVALFRMSMQVEPGRSVAASHGTRPLAFRRWDADGRRSLLAGSGVAALNVLRPYTHFVDYQPLFQRVVDAFAAAAPRDHLVAGQRYINVVRGESAPDPRKLFVIYPRVEGRIGESNPRLALQLEYSSKGDVTIVINLAQIARPDGGEDHLLDIYARATPHTLRTAKDVADWQERAHELVVDAFESCVTDEAKAAWKEG